MPMDLHPITTESFEVIDREVGSHSWSASEYAIVRRAIHATADFELLHLFQFSSDAITAGMHALKSRTPIVVDVRMIAVAVERMAKQYDLPLYCALDYVTDHAAVPTRTAAGMIAVAQQYPQSLFVVGNAPTALLALVDLVKTQQISPALIVGVPVGFIAVEAAKLALEQMECPKIIVKGRKGGSPVAAAILHALMQLELTSTS